MPKNAYYFKAKHVTHFVSKMLINFLTLFKITPDNLALKTHGVCVADATICCPALGTHWEHLRKPNFCLLNCVFRDFSSCWRLSKWPQAEKKSRRSVRGSTRWRIMWILDGPGQRARRRAAALKKWVLGRILKRQFELWFLRVI